MTDTVIDASPQAIHANAATGFRFEEPSVSELIACARRALRTCRQPLSWRKLQVSAMSRDFSWRRSAEAYANLYRSLVAPDSASGLSPALRRVSA
jgi:starch synthase